MQILSQFIIIFLCSLIFPYSSYLEETVSTWENGERRKVHYYYQKKNLSYYGKGNLEGILKKEVNFKDNKKNGVYIEYHDPKLPAAVRDSLFQLYQNDIGEHHCSPADSLRQLYQDKRKEYYKHIPLRISIIKFYKNDVLDSTYTTYFYNGEINTQEIYKDGEKDGEWISYYDNGEINTQGNYKDGEKDGEWISYYYGDDYTVRSKHNFKNGTRHGEYFEYNNKGGIDRGGNYVDGVKVGFWKDRHNIEGNYVDGIKVGFWKERYGLEGSYVDGVKVGPWKEGENNFGEYNANGKKIGFWKEGYREGSYKDGEKDGEWITFTHKSNYRYPKDPRDKIIIKKQFYQTMSLNHYATIDSVRRCEIVCTNGKFDCGYDNCANYPRQDNSQSFVSILLNEKDYSYNYETSKNILVKEINHELSDSASLYGSENKSTSMFEYYDNGNIENEKHYIKSGIRYNSYYNQHGAWRNYCSDGSIIGEINYNQGKIIGNFYSIGNIDFACSFLDTSKKNIASDVRENFLSIKDSMYASVNPNHPYSDRSLGLIEGFCDENGIQRERISYINKDRTYKEIISKLDTIKNSENTFEYKVFFNNNILEEGIISSISYLRSPNSHSINYRKGQLWKKYGKEEKLLMEIIYNEHGGEESRIFYNKEGVEIGRLVNGNGTYISYHNEHSRIPNRYINSYYNHPTHDLIHIIGHYKDGKPTGDWIHYGYKHYPSPDENQTELPFVPGDAQANKWMQNFNPQYKYDVFKIQKRMGLIVDGIFGPKTLAAVRNFQSMRDEDLSKPNSRKIIFKGNLDDDIKNGEWIFSYGITDLKLLWYKGTLPYKVMTNTSVLRSNGITDWFFKTYVLFGGNRNGYWDPIPYCSECGDGGGPESSQITITGKFKDDMQEGLWRAIRTRDDVLLEDAHYKKGLLDGKITYYYENGNKSFEGYYTNGERSGKWIYYYENGDVKAKGKIENRHPDGEWIVYNPDRTIQKDEEKWRFFCKRDSRLYYY